MHKILLISLFLLLPFLNAHAADNKEKLALQLFEQANIQQTLQNAAAQNFPRLSPELAITFNENQDKFDAIFENLRSIAFEKWAEQLTDSYKNMWVIAYTKNFTEAELVEMVKIYSSPVFQKFQTQFAQIDLSHIEQLKNDSTTLMLTYLQLTKEALIEAQKQGLSALNIDEEIEKIDKTKENIQKNSINLTSKKKSF